MDMTSPLMYGIILIKIIFVLICVPAQEKHTPGQIVHIPPGGMAGPAGISAGITLVLIYVLMQGEYTAGQIVHIP